MKRLLLVSAILMVTTGLCAQIIHVPGDQPNIQAGIDAATNGDVVLVDDGTYYENINFRGKAITVASLFWDDGDTNHINNTIIDGSQPVNPDSASVVVFNSGEDTTSVLYGFSITGGQGGCYNVNWDCYVGGGIALFNSGARISHNKIYGNEVNSGAVFGAAGGGIGGIMTNEFPWIIIEHNQVYNNGAIANNYSGFGGGMYIGTNCMISYNEVYNNSCTNSNPEYASGGGIEIEELPGNPELEYQVINNHIHHNQIESDWVYGGGLSIFGGKGLIRDNYIHHNEANATNRCLGGGLRVYLARHKVIIQNNIISENISNADMVQGGGVDIGGAAELVILTDNQILRNELHGTTAAWGAGVNTIQNEHLQVIGNEINENIIVGNQWWCGAGFYNEKAYSSLEISHNIIRDNFGEGTSYGGGIGLYDIEGATYTIGSNLICGNHCNYGAGVWTFNIYDMTMTNNIFNGNEANQFGGAYALRQYTDDMPLNVSIAYATGEEVTTKANSKAMVQPVVANNTFHNNAASVGGAIHSDQNEYVPIFFNNIFWQNNAVMGDDIYYNGPDTLTISYCDINIDSDTNVQAKFTGHGNIFDDPGFEAGDSLCCIHGGPCHNAGTDQLFVSDTTYFAPETDYEGTPRPQGDYWDIGADECLMDFIGQIRDESKMLLSANPNPTSGVLHLRFSIFDPRSSILEIYSIDGVMVKTLKRGVLQAGEHEQTFDISDLPDGIYFVRLQVGNQAETTKVILSK